MRLAAQGTAEVKTEGEGNGGSAASKAAVPGAPAPESQDPTEGEREQREAEFEEALRMRVVRSDMIGRDRHFRRYWWLQGIYCCPSAPGMCAFQIAILNGSWEAVFVSASLGWLILLALSLPCTRLPKGLTPSTDQASLAKEAYKRISMIITEQLQ